MLSEDEAVEQFTEVLDHVVPLGLSVDQQIEANSLLELDDLLDFRLDELVVLVLGQFFLAELETSLSDLLGLLLIKLRSKKESFETE